MARYVDTIAAATAARVKPALIRTWASRGLVIDGERLYLGRQGRDHRNRTLYLLDDVYMFASATPQRPQEVDDPATM